jgi:hypothetical protein
LASINLSSTPTWPESPMSQMVDFGSQFMGEGHQKAFLVGHIYLRIGTGENGEY